MTTITAGMVKELRERTGAGMMECKKALTESHGDMELAIDNMRKAGQAKADKKASRQAAEGLVIIKVSDDNKRAVMIEVNSETDFAAKNPGFSDFAQNTAQAGLEHNVSDEQQLLTAKMPSGETVDESRRNLITKIGENINLRRMVTMTSSAGQVAGYVHSGRIGVLIEIEGGSLALAKDVAMHIAAASPIVVNPTDVPQEVIEKEKEIFSAQAAQSGKPKEIIDKMITGRIKKFLDEVSLLGQEFVKDSSVTVGALLKEKNAKVTKFVRYQVGEGIEKKQDDFAKEVMAQINSN